MESSPPPERTVGGLRGERGRCRPVAVVSAADPTPPPRLKIGEGKISGYLSIFLAVVSFGAVLVFHSPRF